ncbi:MAG: aminotransferase class V-fold PLP-dependent enzyme, partial [Chromatiaceae bacterium]|nr:aminotransferase class V-fold PLP-dependent enzyme [Chromatiaceae bacterium]
LKGTSPHKCAVLSWVMREPPLSTLDVGLQLDRRGICVRTGHHCCEPLMERLGVDATLRASFALYNSAEEVERLGAAIEEILDQARERSASRHAPPVEELAYPAASADSPEAAARELIDSFALLPDWPTRLDYLIELGEHLPAMPEALKNAASRINGCQSLVHLVARRRPDAPERVEFLADSDAALVRGLIALLQQLWSGQSAAAILAFDFNAFLIELGLANQLSMGRRNGLDAMVRRLRQFAAED